jgi:hypothetical protein
MGLDIDTDPPIKIGAALLDFGVDAVAVLIPTAQATAAATPDAASAGVNILLKRLYFITLSSILFYLLPLA